jgi:hypothetical protein
VVRGKVVGKTAARSFLHRGLTELPVVLCADLGDLHYADGG